MRGEQMKLVALDLEGSGAQDREDEAILEIAVVPLHHRQPDLDAAYSTLINPGRPIPQRRWISPGLTDDVLGSALSLSDVEPHLAVRINGAYLVGHNIGVDWRLLHRRCSDLAPAGLIDTLRLARTIDRKASNSLSALVERFALVGAVNRLAQGSVPHRALWDTIAAALLLPPLATCVIGPDATDAMLLDAAGTVFSRDSIKGDPQATLFD
jgi:DNA polymerase III epsilon subunit-like protein